MTNTANITIDEVGALRHLDIPLPADGGVVVLEGANGAGKSTALQAVDALRTGSAKSLTTNDDAESNGRITGMGVSLEVGRRSRRKGEPDDRLVVTEMAGTIDPAMLVDAGGTIGDEAADRKRIKALIDLGGVETTAEDWIEIAGSREDLAEAVDLADIARISPVDVAGKVKRGLEKRAIAHEKREEAHAAKNAYELELLEGIDMSVPCDEAELAETHQNAVRLLMQAEAAVQEAEKRRAQHEADTAKLDELLSVQADGTVEAAQKDVQEAEGVVAGYETRHGQAEAEVLRLETLLQRARDDLYEIQTDHGSAKVRLVATREVLGARQQAESARTALRERLDAYVAPEDMADELTEREQVVADCRAAIDAGTEVRRAKLHSERAAEARRQAQEERTLAESLRNRAAQCEGVLSKMVQAAGIGSLSVRGGRLVVEHEVRGRMPYAELSDGERWRIAFDAAVHRVGPGGIVPVSQTAWEGLDPANRDAIHAAAKAARVTVLTARAADGDVRVVAHGEEG